MGYEDLVGLRERMEQEKQKLVETEIEMETEEADAPRVQSRIYSPSLDEYNRHCAIHLPNWNWCPICVQAKKTNIMHKARTADPDKHMSTIGVDYMFTNEKDDGFLKLKGSYSEYVSKRIADIINHLGYVEVAMKSDQEPAIKDVMYEAKKKVWLDIEK